MSFEAIPGYYLRGQPVPDDLTPLMHRCSGTSCSFCAWRRNNPLELGWERLLDDSESGARLCGVDLSSYQLENPYTEISTQQTADFLATFDDDSSFSTIDPELEQVLSQYDSSAASNPPSVPSATVVVSTAVTTVVSTASQAPAPLIKPPTVAAVSKRVYSSPKGNKAVNVAKPTASL